MDVIIFHEFQNLSITKRRKNLTYVVECVVIPNGIAV